jgi:maltose-binding protein MalE
MKNLIKHIVMLIGIALTVSVKAQTRMPKPVMDNLPGLPGQTDEWWAEYRKAQAEENARKKQARTADVESNFYTGKPYDAEIGGYVFKYRKKITY